MSCCCSPIRSMPSSRAAAEGSSSSEERPGSARPHSYEPAATTSNVRVSSGEAATRCSRLAHSGRSSMWRARSDGELERVAVGRPKPYEFAEALMVELRGPTPTVVVIEDVHWADEATLDVLRIVARRIETLPVLIVATFRDDELDRRHPLRVLLGELALGRRSTRIELGSLSLDAVDDACRTARRRRRRPVPQDVGEPVLRHRGACRRRSRDPGHGPRRRAGPRCSARPRSATRAGGGRGRAAARRTVAARGARRRLGAPLEECLAAGMLRSRAGPCLLQARACPACRRGLAPGERASCTPAPCPRRARVAAFR